MTQAALADWTAEHESPDGAALRPATATCEALLAALSEAHALDDAIYELDRAISNGDLPLSDGLREVRRLARRQHLKKAHAAKLAAAG